MIRKLAERFIGGKPVVAPKRPDARVWPGDLSESTIELFRQIQPYTMTSIERVSSLVDAVEYIVRSRVPGHVVECGVWHGGSMMAAAKTLMRLGDTSRTLYLYDTFAGMNEPTEIDVDFQGVRAGTILKADTAQTGLVWARSTLSDVQGNLASTGYPTENMRFIEGPVESTLPQARPDGPIALLRLDTDWYESTRHELNCLYPILSPGGILLIDDYGHWQGARKAVDEYVAEHSLPLFLARIDYTGRVAVKPFKIG